MLSNYDKERRRNDDCYFKNGRPKKMYMKCQSAEYINELKRINGAYFGPPSCAGLRCPLYAKGCDNRGRDWKK